MPVCTGLWTYAILLQILYATTVGFVIDGPERPVCPSIECHSGGFLAQDTCVCVCPSGYGGFLCEKEFLETKWPKGQYAILSTVFGCPEISNIFGWRRGYVNMTVRGSTIDQRWKLPYPPNADTLEENTADPHLLGPYYLRSIQLNFCTRHDQHNDTNGDNGHYWPKGNYCVFKQGQMCPEGFSESHVMLAGYHTSWSNIDGVIPNMKMNESSGEPTFWYCCRADGDDEHSMTNFPSEFPFILTKPVGSNCTEVPFMTVTEEQFDFVDELSHFDHEGQFNMFDLIDDKYRRLGLCYYAITTFENCYHKQDGGFSYQGNINVSKSGRPCFHWYELPAGASSENFRPHKNYVGDFNHNHCRTYFPYGAMVYNPWCFVNISGKLTWEACDVPVCEEDIGLETVGTFKPVYSVKERGDDLATNAVDGVVGQPFVADRPTQKPWIQVDLEESVEVHVVLIYRSYFWFANNVRFISVHVSNDQWDFLNYGALQCQERRYPRRAIYFRFQCYRPIRGQYVTLRNFDDPNPITGTGNYYRFEIAEIKVFVKKNVCSRRMGMVSGGVRDFQLSGSSEQRLNNYNDGRMNSEGNGWCATPENNTYYEVDMIVPVVIDGIEIQGARGSESNIQDFYIEYSVNYNEFHTYTTAEGRDKLFRIDPDIKLETFRFLFLKSFIARKLRIQIVQPTEGVCAKFEIIGCPKRVVRDLYCRDDDVILYGYEEMTYSVFWIEDVPVLNETIHIDECLERCTAMTSECVGIALDQRCSVLPSSRYNPHFQHWFLPKTFPTTFTYTKMCVKDVQEYSNCSRTITSPTELTSPSYPMYYGTLLDCQWSITFSMGTFIRVEITDVHLPQPISDIQLRERGYFDLRIGTCLDRIMLGNLTIDHTNQHVYGRSVLVSSSNQLVIKLKSCARYAAADDMSGFKMLITQSDYPGCGMTSSKCSSVCKTTTGIIASPGFPSSFTSTCTWTITGLPGQYILLTFKVVSIYSSDSSCDENSVTVLDVARFADIQDWEPKLGRFCSKSIPDRPIKSSWESLEIILEVDLAYDGTRRIENGFQAEYQMVYQLQDSYEVTSEGCDDGWISYTGSCYRLFSEEVGLTWLEAESRCNHYSGHLVSLRSRDETNFIHYLLTSYWTDLLNDTNDIYIGLRKSGEDGLFKDLQWTDGSPVTFTAWYQSSSVGAIQPDGLGNEKCTFISLNSIHSINNWHDAPCAFDQHNVFICEINNNNESQVEPVQNWYTLAAIRERNMFQCGSGEIIHDIYICDDHQDCSDGSDEVCGDKKVCTDLQFHCSDDSCIPGDLVCDFRPDCDDKSDEYGCDYPPCNSDQWSCASGQCIPMDVRCDVKVDCLDGTDELNCVTCQNSTFTCYDQTCMPQSRVCDRNLDCSGKFNEDEIQPECSANSRLDSCASWFSIGRLENGTYSVLLGTKDGVDIECQFIEENGGIHAFTIIHHQLESEIYFTFPEKTLYLEYRANDDQIANLKHMSASCRQHVRVRCSYSRTRAMYWTGDNGYIFFNGRTTINPDCTCPITGKCDDNETCACSSLETIYWYGRDHDVFLMDEGIISDLEVLPIRSIFMPDMISNFDAVLTAQLGPLICSEEIQNLVEDSIVCANGVLGPIESVCKMYFDEYGDIVGCRDLSHLEDCEAEHCGDGFTKCPNSYCIWKGLVCDGVRHCPNSEDEHNCDFNNHCDGMFSCRDSTLCIPMMNVCDGISHCPLSDDELLCNITCPSNCTCSKRTMACDFLAFLSSPEAMIFKDSLLETRVLKVHSPNNLNLLGFFEALAYLDLSSIDLSSLQQGQFGNLSNLLHLDLSHNNIIEILPGSFDGLHKLLVLKLYGNPLTRLYPDSFVGLSSLVELDLSRFMLNTLVQGIFSGLDSLQNLTIVYSKIGSIQDRTFEPLNSLTTLDLRQNEIKDFGQFLFSGLTSLSQLYVDSFTLCCIKPSGLFDEKCSAPKNEFSSCSDLLRNNFLSVSIWVIGIIAFIGNTIVLVVRFVFDKDGFKKTYNVFVCNLSVADCLMGIYLIILGIADAVFRGEYTWNDYQWRNGTSCKVAGVISAIASEGSVLFLCLITLDRLLVVKFPFGNVRISRRMSFVLSAVIWMVVLLLACIPLIGESDMGWSFYSRSAVCLPLPLTRDRPVGYEYAVGLFIVFNFIAFLLIAAAQIAIYLEVSTSRSNVASKGRRVDISVARKLFFVAITDFMCWFPIGLMGIMALNGQVISGEVYAWIAVFVLPINSALNPFLYTLGTSISTMMERMRGKLSPSKSTRRDKDSRSVTDVVSSDMFVFGEFDAKDRRKMTLKRFLEIKKVSIMDVYKIARQVCKAMDMLHSTEMVHGKVSTDTVMITTANGKLNRVMLRSIPVTCLDEEDFKKDIDQYGALLRTLVRVVDTN